MRRLPELPKIGLLTNQHTHCGIAEYGRDLVSYLSDYYNVHSSSSLQELIDGYPKVILVNWQPVRTTMTVPMVKAVQAAGIKVIVIFHDSCEWTYGYSDNDMLACADAVVAHEKLASELKLDVIPFGIPLVDNLPVPSEPKVGVAGFPFPWKRFDVVVSAAAKFGIKCCMIAPQHEYFDSAPFIAKTRKDLGSLAEIYTDWLPTEMVVKLLASCTLNIFWFESQIREDQVGQSGSVRLGIAARRPVIISAHRKFKTLLPYLDEIYMATTEEVVFQYVAQILRGEHVKRPNRILDDMGWNRTAEMYRELIERIAPQGEVRRGATAA